MFRRNTLFVVGAGASAEFGLPLGTLLARQITSKMDIRFESGFEFVGSGDLRLYEQLTNARRQDSDEWQPAAMRIRDGLPFAQSIDDFLDQRRSDNWVNLYGKSAICQAILEAERQSKLYFNSLDRDAPFDANAISDTWLVKFMYMLSRGVPRENVAHIFERVSFIVFNYDRCIEQFLISSLERAYSITRDDAAAVVNNLEILHPYGSVGRLAEISYGNSAANCVALATQIKTYTEQADEETVLNKINSLVDNAECVVFLGFAYHSQNMQMLRTTNRNGKVVYGTAFGMSGPDIGEVHKSVAQTLSPSTINLDGLKCAGLFDNYAKSLTGGD
jgi:hypothetical protein